MQIRPHDLHPITLIRLDQTRIWRRINEVSVEFAFSGHSDGGGATALVAFGGDDLIVVGSKIQADVLPRVEVVLHGDSTPNPLGGANGPVLLKGLGSVDRGGVGPSSDINVVCTAIGGDTALALTAAARVIGAIRLDHVVLDQRVASPPVNGQVSIAAGIEAARIADRPVVNVNGMHHSA